MTSNSVPDSRPEVPQTTVGRQESGFYEAYAGFARNLRIWFIAYGVGGPVVFLTNEAAGQALLASGPARRIAYTVLAGVGLQILLALLYKTAMWYLYLGELDDSRKSWMLYKVSEWLSDSYWIELVSDAATLVLFGWATLDVLHALTP